MKSSLVMVLISLIAICISSTASASFNYDSDEIKNKVIDEALRQDIMPSLALAIAKVESNFNPQALSHAGAKGVMQIMPRTAEQVFGVSRQRLFDPQTNIELGVKFIKQLLERYDNRLDIALSHYNGGSAVRSGHGKLAVIPATRQYVDKVMATQKEFLNHDSVQPNNLQKGSLHKSLLQSDAYTKLEPSSQPQDPQIEALRAIRLHNITRNYQFKRANNTQIPEATNQVVGTLASPEQFNADTRQPTAQLTINARIAKVRQWESIY